MNPNKIIFIIFGLLFVIGFVLAALFGHGFSSKNETQKILLPERNDTTPAVPFLYDFGTKIVYTTDTTIKKDLYINDCAVRGGVFDICGSPCAPTANTCSSICALTCTVK